MLCRPCWNSIAYEYCLVNVIQIRLIQHCTRKLLAQCWLKAHRYTFIGKPAVSNMSGTLFLTGHYITEQSWLFLLMLARKGGNNEQGPTLTGIYTRLHFMVSICFQSLFKVVSEMQYIRPYLLELS